MLNQNVVRPFAILLMHIIIVVFGVADAAQTGAVVWQARLGQPAPPRTVKNPSPDHGRCSMDTIPELCGKAGRWVSIPTCSGRDRISKSKGKVNT